MNDSFDNTKSEDRNLVAKLRNTVAEMNFYCYRCLVRSGFRSSPRTGVSDAESLFVLGEQIPPQVTEILRRYYFITEFSTPETANELFYSTWQFLHDYDKTLNDGIF